jgi:hypothetical protein
MIVIFDTAWSGVFLQANTVISMRWSLNSKPDTLKSTFTVYVPINIVAIPSQNDDLEENGFANLPKNQ